MTSILMKVVTSCILIFTIVIANGCDFLNYDETTVRKKNEVFSNFDRTKAFLNNIYAQIPDGFNSIGDAMRASASDNAFEINKQSRVHQMTDGSWSAINTIDSNWSNMYDAIRSTNEFLENLDPENFKDRQYNDDYDQLKDQLQYFAPQARFLRAFFYFKLLKRYGHLPLVKKTLTPDEANNVKPASYEKVTQFIVNECDTVASRLPVDYHSVSKQETGRVTRGAAMALKARALLYAASPLHNPSDDKSKWVKAAKAAKAIIDSSWYSLEANYSDVVNNRTSKELILGRRNGASNNFERDNFPVGYENADPGTAPTQSLVDAYDMQATGKSINAAGSGYDPSHPYEGRDPRLKKTVIVNNSPWKQRRVQIWRQGLDGLPKVRATPTGYYLKKYVIESIDIESGNTNRQIHTWVIFRYGGILLDYAEAMNEAYGPENAAGMGMTARQAADKIRERANMPDFPTGMNKSEFRKKIHSERRVEMAFENQRFWDIRRWKIGPSTTDINGMGIIRNDDGSFTYNRKGVETRVWNDRLYLYPIPQTEIYKNKALQQNPGW